MSKNDAIRRPKIASSENIALAALLAFVAVLILFCIFQRLPGAITASDFVNFIAAVVTVISLLMTLVLAIIAVNTFSYVTQFQELKEHAAQLRKQLEERAVNADRMLELFPVVIESIMGEIRKSPDERAREDRDYSYYRLVHVRLFLKLLIASDRQTQIDVCRDIVGSARPGDSRDLLEQTLDVLHQLQNESAEDRDLIDPLIREGTNTLQQMPYERYLDHGRSLRKGSPSTEQVSARRPSWRNFFRIN